MAVKDVRLYFYKMQNQYLEMKEDLKDFEEALKAGYITEDKLTEVKKDVDIVEANYDRLLYIMKLLDMPNRQAKKPKYKKQHRKEFAKLAETKSDEAAVLAESKEAEEKLKEDLNDLTK